MVHGAAGSALAGAKEHYWSPEKAGRDFEFTSSLRSLEPFRDYITIVSNTDLNGAAPWSPREEGADHTRSSAVLLTAAHPKMTEGSDFQAGPSIDQMYAQAHRAGHADSVDPVVHRGCRIAVGRVRLRLQLRLHRRDLVGDRHDTAAVGA